MEGEIGMGLMGKGVEARVAWRGGRGRGGQLESQTFVGCLFLFLLNFIDFVKGNTKTSH